MDLKKNVCRVVGHELGGELFIELTADGPGGNTYTYCKRCREQIQIAGTI